MTYTSGRKGTRLSSLDVSGGAPAVASRLSIRVTALCWFLVLLDGLDLFVYGASLPGVLADKGFGMTLAVAGDIGSPTAEPQLS